MTVADVIVPVGRWTMVVIDPAAALIDPDEVRDVACGATSSESVCEPPARPEPPVPDGGPSSGGGSAGGVGQLLVIVLVIALVAVLAWLIWTLIGGRGVRASGGDGDADDSEDLDEPVEQRAVDVANPPDRWRRAAADHRARGEYRDAVRCEYRAVVGELARRGHLDEIPGRTSGEERAQLAEGAPADSTLPAQFSDAADIFDRAWFDDGEVTAADDERFVAAASSVLVGASSGGGGRR